MSANGARPGSPRFVEKAAQRAAAQKAAQSCAGAVAFIVLSIIAFTLGWNYGVTEVIEALGGPDANVNLAVGSLAWLFTRAVQK